MDAPDAVAVAHITDADGSWICKSGGRGTSVAILGAGGNGMPTIKCAECAALLRARDSSH